MLRFAFLVSGAAAQLGWPTGSVHHQYFDTENGQLHYVVSDLRRAHEMPTMVYLHSHPRSSADFRYVHAELSGMPFVAVDWFGMGWSEDYVGKGGDDQFCTFEAFATHVLGLLDHLKIEQFIPVGGLKGAHVVPELAAQAGPKRVKKVVSLGMLMLSPDQQDFINNILVPMGKHPDVFANGTHLQGVWDDPSGTWPIYPGEELVNQEKTNDNLRGYFTNWQMQAAWGAYNEKLPLRLADIDAVMDTLFVHPLIAYDIWTTMGLDPSFSLSKMDEVLTHGRNTSHFVRASEGMLHQNASYIAGLLKDFATTKESILV